ncbi:MAG: cell division protein FtsW [Candidatus Kapabacteria bacterium]|nr:cell division protein FtsW [Candidatus Kapabacteria bacterium]
MKSSGNIDWYIALVVTGLMLFSITFVYSASATFADVKFGSSEQLFYQHLIRVIIALVIMIVMSRIDYHHLREFTRPLMVVSLLLLLYVKFGGVAAKGATRWVNFGFISFQPSELAKFALLIHVSRLLADKKEKIVNFKEGILPPLIWICIVCGLIALQPNFSTSFVVFLLSLTLIILAGAQKKHLLALGATGVIAGGIFAIGAEYRMKRLLAYFGSEQTANSPVVYQLQQALLAFGNGGFLGVGPGQSRQRDWFLPEPYGDFIFSIVGEEYGYLGVILILMGFGIVLWRGVVAARFAPDTFGFLLASGITLTLCFYAFINAGVNCGLLPTTGLPMPFVSYGGTSILFSAAAVGILLNISGQRKM